jgi:hypothetical protein
MFKHVTLKTFNDYWPWMDSNYCLCLGSLRSNIQLKKVIININIGFTWILSLHHNLPLNNIIIVKTFNPEARLTIVKTFDFKTIIKTTNNSSWTIIINNNGIERCHISLIFNKSFLQKINIKKIFYWFPHEQKIMYQQH